MRVILQTACVLAVVIWGVQADAQERKTVFIHSGYLTGEDCLRDSDNSMASYMMGVVNGLLISPFYGALEQNLKPLLHCLTGVTPTQLAAMLKKWLRENPERWHEGCNVAAYMALNQMCENP